MLRFVVTLMLLVLGAVALARGLYLRAELTRQLDTGAMGVVRSWIMWSTSDGRALVAWYRRVTPWLLWGGGGTLVLGLVLAVLPERAGETRQGPVPAAKQPKAGTRRDQTPRPRRKRRGTPGAGT